MTAKPRHTVLAVDDERSNLLTLYRILSPGYALITAKTGAEALARAASNVPDLILLDIVLPDMSGYDVLRKLKAGADTKGIPVIVATGLGGVGEEEKSAGLGAAGFIAKPYEREAVLGYARNLICK
jgi:CheY-like chemotaxis protein